MKIDNSLFCALIQLGVLVSMVTLPGFAESQATVSMRPYKGTRTVVAVKVNRAGPYDFMVDTGATVTVLDSALFRELGLRPEGLSQLTSSAGATSQIRSAVKEISLDCLSVRDITVVSLPAPILASGYRAIRGILGENFLRHFDILVDNQHRTMTLDAGDGLADSLTGERVPITFTALPEGDDYIYRPMISVRAESFGRAKLLLDSGADSIVLLLKGSQLKGFGDGMRMRTLNGVLACADSNDTLHLGSRTVIDLMVASCRSATVKRQDYEGVLPTAIFKQIFISHAGSYAIIEPARRSNVP